MGRKRVLIEPVVERAPEPVAVSGDSPVERAAWTAALALAGGDARLLRRCDDGKVIILNSADHPVAVGASG